MYQSAPQRLDLIKMCEDCRVIVVAREGFDPHDAPPRPKLRTTDDYLRERETNSDSIVIPPAMGVIADHWGAGQSFVILGAILIVLCAPVTLITRRAARTVTQAEPTLSD